MSDPLSDALIQTLSAHLELGKSQLLTLSGQRQGFFQLITLEGDWLALVVVKLLKLKGPWILCLDRTNRQIGRHDVNILMLAMTTRRFRIPSMWTILDKAGSSNQGEWITLMQRYLALFGSTSFAWLLAEVEFIGGRWIGFLLENNILFAIRIKENSRVHLEDERCYQLKSLLRKRTGFKRLRQRSGRLWTMDEDLGAPLHFAAKRVGKGELLIVATNGPANNALNAYRRRWQIECLFGDSKTRGLNMEDARLTKPAKLDTSLVIVTLSMAWTYACATVIKGTVSIKTKVHGYRAKSWFRLGFDQLRKWILHQQNDAADIWNRIWPKRKSTIKSSCGV